MKVIFTLLCSFILLFNTPLSAQTTTFNYTGDYQFFTVPASVTSLTVSVRGAQGANATGPASAGTTGATGGSVQCILAVTPGQLLWVTVGGAATSTTAGFHGGGYGSFGSAVIGGNTTQFSGGGGGGFSEIAFGRYDSSAVIAGGGGGGGAAYSFGAPGGQGGTTTGQSGMGFSGQIDAYSGEGGNQKQGGSSGIATNNPTEDYPNWGSRFNGGFAASGSGGGGGGYYGGGAGGLLYNTVQGSLVVTSAAGGGGGSSWVDSTAVTDITMLRGGNTGNGSITITVISAQAVPIVSTQPATNVYADVATLNAFVNDNSAPALINFEYGTDPTMAIVLGTPQGSPASLSPGAGNIATSLQLSGLLTNTTYYYRVIANGPGGTAKGSILSFKTTLPGKSIVTTLAAIYITATTAELRGTIYANGATTTKSFEYSTDSTFITGVLTVAVSPLPGYLVAGNTSGLVGNTTYYYRIIGVNSNGTSYGSILNFKTLFSEYGRYVTIQNGKWDDYRIWDVGSVPTANSQVVVRHGITITTNSSCYSLRLEPGADVYLYSNTKLNIMH